MRHPRTGVEDQGADHWYALLTAVGVPPGPINDLSEAFAFAHKLGIVMTVTVPGSPTPQVANPMWMSVTPVTYRNAPPALGNADPVTTALDGVDRTVS